jgi:LPXTG-site transpeptidase (sortase) family protein
MSKKVYIKDHSFDPIYKTINPYFYFQSKILSGSLMALGFLILGTQVVLPLVFFKTQNTVAKPIRASVLGVATGYNEFEFSELKTKDGKTTPVNGRNVPEYFHITVPKLGIVDAIVETNSENLSPETSLGHYKGSALPGEVGNSFIYGHSVLPWFYNPKNYRTIFSTLDNLQSGDELTINFNNKDLKYKVESKIVLDPEKVNPLADYKPKYLNESTITLMTCYPAGTRAKRLLVNAVLVN